MADQNGTPDPVEQALLDSREETTIRAQSGLCRRCTCELMDPSIRVKVVLDSEGREIAVCHVCEGIIRAQGRPLE